MEGLRQRKKQKTRERLEAAAVRLFASQGYGETSIEAIAAEAEVSASTFFRYFGAKHEVLFWRQPEYLGLFLEIVRRRPTAATDLPSLGAALVEFATLLDGHADQILALTQLINVTPELQSRQLQLRSEWEEALAAQLAAEADLPVPDLRARAVAAALLAVFDVARRAWCDDGGAETLADVVGRAVDHLPELLVSSSGADRPGA